MSGEKGMSEVAMGRVEGELKEREGGRGLGVSERQEASITEEETKRREAAR